MTLNQLLDRLSRMVIRSAMDSGIDAATRGGKPESELTPEERQQAKAAKSMTQRFRKATSLGRRFFR